MFPLQYWEKSVALLEGFLLCFRENRTGVRIIYLAPLPADIRRSKATGQGNTYFGVLLIQDIYNNKFSKLKVEISSRRMHC